MWVQEAVYTEKEEGEKSLNTRVSKRMICLHRIQQLYQNTTSYLSYLCAVLFICDISEHVLSAILFDVPTIKDGKQKEKNKWWRMTWVLVKRAGGRGAKALAHIIFLFSALIKQSACHCSKVNRLTFKYTVVSGASCPRRCIFSARENWSTPPYLLFKSPPPLPPYNPQVLNILRSFLLLLLLLLLINQKIIIFEM